jgi:hypothetical protein
VCDWLHLRTPQGLWRLLDRLDLCYKRGRLYVHSPDPLYTEKLAAITDYLQQVREQSERLVFLYLDELTFYRQPTVAKDYAPRGAPQPLARRSHHSNTPARILGALNALTGQVTYVQRSHTSLATFRDFYYQVRTTYPDAERIYIAQDNWPLHFHPDITVILEPQTYAWPPKLPGNWPTEPRPNIAPDNLPIQLLFQPTYAPWTNPIEKLWRWLYQDRLHLHRLSDKWDDLKKSVTDFLDTFGNGSPELLRYVGLLPG